MPESNILEVAHLIGTTFLLSPQFILAAVAPDLCTPKVRRRSDLLVLLIFATIVSLGIKLVGTLLMGALTIIPASIAWNLTGSIKRYMLLSTVIGAVMTAIGAFAAHRFALIPGPTIVLFGSGLFVLSLGSRGYRK